VPIKMFWARAKLKIYKDIARWYFIF
jgi:hypothetical protein